MLTKKILLVAALGVVMCVALAAAFQAPRPEAMQTPVGLTGTLKPLSGGNFMFSATITDLRSGEAIAAPQLRFASGDSAAVKIESNGGEALELTVTADRARNRATVELVELHGAVSTTLSRLDLQLQ
jgi:hypothetical protein